MNYKNRERDVRFIISRKKIWKIWTLNILVIKLQIKKIETINLYIN